MRSDPLLTLVVLLLIGIVAGIIYDRVAGPGWLSRQIAGSTRSMVTSALVGIAGSFIGFHLAGALALRGALIGYLAAAVGAAAVLFAWRMVK
jgi:uncharacterized membrane protein YeaQ/YmgE (transglycosylase-associated protein family)